MLKSGFVEVSSAFKNDIELAVAACLAARPATRRTRFAPHSSRRQLAPDPYASTAMLSEKSPWKGIFTCRSSAEKPKPPKRGDPNTSLRELALQQVCESTLPPRP